ncbi:MAG: hypothetical protein JWO31_1774 [Phycisphaerales bacterium]|nr:hypothetical protein [Phycisphaerales bacterium]
MLESNDERHVIDYAGPEPPARRARRPLTVNEFGCALVSVLYGIPLLALLILALIVFFSDKD